MIQSKEMTVLGSISKVSALRWEGTNITQFTRSITNDVHKLPLKKLSVSVKSHSGFGLAACQVQTTNQRLNITN